MLTALSLILCIIDENTPRPFCHCVLTELNRMCVEVAHIF